MTAWIPLDEKMIVAMNITRSQPPLLFVTISIIVVSRKLKALTGIMLSKSLISSSWKFGIGINGISVKRKIDAGNRAISRLNAIAEALVTRTPFRKPLMTNLKTWFTGTPSKPGKTRLLSFLSPLVPFIKCISYSAFKLMSRLLIWCVRAPTEMKSTPHSA